MKLCVCQNAPWRTPLKATFLRSNFVFSLKTPTQLTDPMDPWSKWVSFHFFCIEIIRMSLQCTHYSWDKKCIYLKNENVYYHLNYYLCQISKLIFSFLFLARCGGCLLLLKGFVWRRLFLRELSLFHTQSIHRIEKAFVGRISHFTLLHCIAWRDNKSETDQEDQDIIMMSYKEGLCQSSLWPCITLQCDILNNNKLITLFGKLVCSCKRSQWQRWAQVSS